ncbi:MAG: 1-deoxy-D-xylulose-5-phosphate synthase [Clostridiales bacterium]|nr:1-deoxy-D-xylulose-5-phosphate synthase [Clostridiales bacterium]
MTECGSLLGKIQSPDDLKKLSPKELRELAGETRQFLIDTVSRTGGHLASNLGVVELTLALHYSFDTPRDRLIWDVGHQCYVHKIITGRRDEMDTLRRYGGLSGFPKRRESEYDAFDTGHSSTAISAALGMARARDLRGERHAVVAVVGDGAMTGGMAWEALNDAGHKQDRIIIVLNDNEMSITRNVGALSSYLARLRGNLGYIRFKKVAAWLLDHIPFVGVRLFRWAERIKNSLKYLLVPGMYFEEMGFTYYGPINGHDLGQLVPLFQRVRHSGRPVLIHVVTQKGRGYAPAQADPERYHSTGEFARKPTDQPVSGGESDSCDMRVGELLTKLGRRDDRICVITAAMAQGCGLRPFISAFPGRSFDVGIAEQHAATLAAGMAAEGFRPVFAVYSSFLQRAYDQVLDDICLQSLPVLLLISHSGLVGADGETHHGIFDHAYLRHMPGMRLVAPSSMERLLAVIEAALKADGPTAICYPRRALPESLGEAPRDVFEWSAIRTRPGARAALLAVGSMAPSALEAARILHEVGFPVDVVDAAAIKPLDTDMLNRLLAEKEYLFTLEDGILQGGFGGAVLEYAGVHGGGARIVPLGYDDRFVGHGTQEQLREECGLSPAGIAERILRAVGGRSGR